MALIEIKWNPSERETLQFAAISLPVFLAAVGGVLYWRYAAPNAAVVCWGIAACVGIAAALFPAIRRPIYVGWMCAVFPIGWLVSHVLMACIYYLLIAPIGCVLRLCGHDPLGRQFDREADTYWVPHEPRDEKTDYFRQF